MGRHLELSEIQRVFARKKRREAGDEEMAHEATEARSRLNGLMFGAFNVRTAVVNEVNGIDQIYTLLKPCAVRSCDVIEFQEIKRNGTSEIVASSYRVNFS